MKDQKRIKPCKAREYLKKKWVIGDVKGMRQNMENGLLNLAMKAGVIRERL